MSSRLRCLNILLGVSALHYSTGKHGRFGRIRALASADALHLTTYYHVPSILDSIPEVRKLIRDGSVAFRRDRA